MANNVIYFNQIAGRAGVRCISSNTFTPANFALLYANSSPMENVFSFNLSKMIWATANITAGITIARGANNKLALTGQGVVDFSSMGMSLTEDNAANLVITIPDTASFVIVEVHKQSNISPTMIT